MVYAHKKRMRQQKKDGYLGVGECHNDERDHKLHNAGNCTKNLTVGIDGPENFKRACHFLSQTIDFT